MFHFLLLVETLISSDPLSEAGARFQAIDLLFVPDSDPVPSSNQHTSLYNCVMQVSYSQISINGQNNHPSLSVM